MIKKELHRTLSLDYKFIGEVVEIEDENFELRLFEGRDKSRAKSIDDALRLVKMKTAGLQEISPIPCAVSVIRKNKRKTYILFPNINEAPSIELPSYHFIRVNAAATNSSLLRLARHVNPNNISFNDLARVILYEKTGRYIWNVIISILTALTMLLLIGTLSIFPFVSRELRTIANITDHPVAMAESLISSIAVAIFGFLLAFLSIVPHVSFRRNLKSKEDGSSFEMKSWWKQYRFRLRVNLLSRLAMLGIVVSGLLAAYFSSETVYMNAYYTNGVIITAQRAIFYIALGMVILMIITIQLSLTSNTTKRKQYLESYVEPDNRPLFDAWGKSPRVKDMKFEFDYETYRFKPTPELLEQIDIVFEEKSKLNKVEKAERLDWLETNYKKAISQYLAKKRKLNKKSRI